VEFRSLSGHDSSKLDDSALQPSSPGRLCRETFEPVKNLISSAVLHDASSFVISAPTFVYTTHQSNSNSFNSAACGTLYCHLCNRTLAMSRAHSFPRHIVGNSAAPFAKLRGSPRQIQILEILRLTAAAHFRVHCKKYWT